MAQIEQNGGTYIPGGDRRFNMANTHICFSINVIGKCLCNVPATGTYVVYLILNPEYAPNPSETKYTSAVFPLHLMSPGRIEPQNERISGDVTSFPS